MSCCNRNHNKWKRYLIKELQYERKFRYLNINRLEKIIKRTGLLSKNHDTFLSLDWPHYCKYATDGCGGKNGWCYTFFGNQATQTKLQKVALVDFISTKYPEYFAEKVEKELSVFINKGKIRYKNIRFSGYGEINKKHLKALHLLASKDIRMWGFTKNPWIIKTLLDLGIYVLFSCDKTTPSAYMDFILKSGIDIAYTSSGINDRPPLNTKVTFPVHISGNVKEVIDHESLCPKVVEEFLTKQRQNYWCQLRCQRCHGSNR